MEKSTPGAIGRTGTDEAGISSWAASVSYWGDFLTFVNSGTRPAEEEAAACCMLRPVAPELVSVAPKWAGWPARSVRMFIAAGVEPSYANKVFERTGSRDPERIIAASAKLLPASWA